MIKTFKSKALAALWNKGDASKLPPEQVARIKARLSQLDCAMQPEDMNVPGYFFHALTGDRVGSYSVRVNGNWRITFQWEGQDAIAVDHEDYH